jgi:hypothetical protein
MKYFLEETYTIRSDIARKQLTRLIVRIAQPVHWPEIRHQSERCGRKFDAGRCDLRDGHESRCECAQPKHFQSADAGTVQAIQNKLNELINAITRPLV